MTRGPMTSLSQRTLEMYIARARRIVDMGVHKNARHNLVTGLLITLDKLDLVVIG